MSETVVLSVCEDNEILRFTHLLKSENWGGKYMDAERYAEREQELAQCEVSKLGSCEQYKRKFPREHHLLGSKNFILKDLSLPEKDKFSQVVSSCDAMTRVGWAVHPDSEGKVQPVLCICICSVHTLPQHRGKKYASALITKVNEYWDAICNAEGASNMVRNAVIFLYSEVGEYYSQFGYASAHVPLHKITKLDQFRDEYCEKPKSALRYLGYDDYEDLVEQQRENLHREVAQRAKKSDKEYIFTVAPGMESYKWFQIRDTYVAKHARGELPRRFGAATASGAHIVWHHKWSDNTLVILIASFPDEASLEDDLKELLYAAVKEMEYFNISILEFWDEEIDRQAAPGLFEWLLRNEKEDNVYAANGSLSALRVPRGITGSQVEWVKNTYFCWA